MKVVFICAVIVYSLILQQTLVFAQGPLKIAQAVNKAAPKTGTNPLIDPDAPGGARGDEKDIREVQQRLKATGFNPGPVDGRLNTQTRKAIRDYQKVHGLQPTGTLNQPTYKSLMAGKPSGNEN